MSALDALASSAEASRPQPNGAAADDGQHVGSVAQEERAGGPRMPAAGIAGAATKASLDHQLRQQPASSSSTAVKLGVNGVGDAAMAAVDGRLDDDLAHVNGQNVPPINGQLVNGHDDRLPPPPPLSADVDQPPAPGNLDTAASSISASDTGAPQLPPAQQPVTSAASLSNLLSTQGEAYPAPTTTHDDSSSSYPPAQDTPVGGLPPHRDAASAPALELAPSSGPHTGMEAASLSAAGFHAASLSAAGISPSTLAKRPFEPDNSEASQPFQDALNVNAVSSAAAGGPYDMPAGASATLGEPDSKRVKLSPSPSPFDTRQHAGTLGTAPDPEHLREQIGAVQTAQDEQQLRAEVGAPASATVKAEGLSAEGDADAEEDVDAEALEEQDAAGESLVDTSAVKQENAGLVSGIASYDNSMNIDNSLDASGLQDRSGLGDETAQYGLQAQVDADQALPTPGDMSHDASATSAGGPQPIQAMPKEQIKYALSTLRYLKKRPEAGPFVQPVDPVGLGIPHYADIISQPMDMGTIERKLQNHQYASSDDFATDMRLIWQNCYTFNGRESAISVWAQTLEGLFEKQLAKMPSIASLQAKEAERIANREAIKEASMKRSQSPMGRAGSKDKKRRTSTAAYDDYGGEYSPKAGPSIGGSSKSKPKKAGSGLSGSIGSMSGGMGMGGMGGTPGSAQFQFQQLQMQQQAAAFQIQQMQQMQQMQHHGNGSHVQQDQLAFCKEILKELFSKRHSSFAHVFYDPVDYVTLGIPEYPKIIRRPMDLGTMRRKLDSGMYPSAAAFEADFKLLIQNCFTFNPAGNPVNNMGVQLQRVFYNKWAEMPQEDNSGGWGGGYGGYNAGYGAMGNDFDQIAMMQKQLELLTGNLEMMRNKAAMQGSGGPMGGMQMGGMPNMGGMPYAASPPLYGGATQIMPMQQQQPQQPQQQPPVALPKAPRQPPPPRVRPPPKRKPSESYTAPPSAALTAPPSAPKPRTTKNSKMVAAKGELDIDYHPPIRGLGNTSDYEEDAEGSGQPAVTFDMKKELAEKIQEFDGDKLEKVVEIIRNSAPDLLGADNQEIELDIDMLDQRTLLKLFEYVVRPVGKGRQLKPKKNKPKGRNRGVDEVAEEERINALQATLDAMEGGAGGVAGLPNLPTAPPVGVELPNPGQQAGRGDVASSSSDEDDDGPESDSDSDNFNPSS